MISRLFYELKSLLQKEIFTHHQINDSPFKNYIFYQQLCELPYVDKIFLFGSRARGDHGKKSDIDLALFCPAADELQWMVIIQIVEEADTLLKIDCVRCDSLSKDSRLLINIYKEGVCLYEKINTTIH